MPKSETEKSLKDSLKDMEIRCKERVDLLQALKQSREDESSNETSTDDSSKIRKSSKSKQKSPNPENVGKGFIGNGTVPAMDFPDLSRTRPPPLPQRPVYLSKSSSEFAVVGKKKSHSPPRSNPDSRNVTASSSTSSTSLAPPHQMKKTSRSPSPEKGRSMLQTLRGPDRTGKKPSSKSPRLSSANRENPVTSKAASMAWQTLSTSGRDRLGRSLDTGVDNSTTTLPELTRTESYGDPSQARPTSANVRYDSTTRKLVPDYRPQKQHASSPPDLLTGTREFSSGRGYGGGQQSASRDQRRPSGIADPVLSPAATQELIDIDYTARTSSGLSLPPQIPPKIPAPPPPPPHAKPTPKLDPVGYPTYLQEYPETSAKRSNDENELASRLKIAGLESNGEVPSRAHRVTRKPVSANISSPRNHEKHRVERRPSRKQRRQTKEESETSPDEPTNALGIRPKKPVKQKETPLLADPITPTSDESEDPVKVAELSVWDMKVAGLMKNLPKGVDETAAKQIFNEIVVHGDEVHWEDVAGLDIAKKALKEAVVYPFLRPDLFMGLREPARGMLLFGPPGTGKTMLARAVATESRSTFFSISASSLTSKFLGESEKLVRALFSLAKALAPSIIFVDEIDSLLSTRSNSGEHEATRRIKTEFLIQWSDLQRAAAGREQSDKEKERGDASRVLVLAATNVPWAIDEAARRRFVRRQYIPLPEDETRAVQLRTLLGHQKHSLNERDIQHLVDLTDGESFR